MASAPSTPSDSAALPASSFRWRDLVLPVGLSLVVLGVIVAVTYEPGTLTDIATTLDLRVAALAPLALAGMIVIGGFRLRFFAHGHIGWRGGARGQIAWDFMSAVTPSAIGGAPLAGYFVAKDNRIPVGEATALLLFAMLMDQVWFATTIPIILIAASTIEVFPAAIGTLGAGLLTTYFVILWLWVGLFAFATLIRPQILSGIARRLVMVKWLRRFRYTVVRETRNLEDRAALIRGESVGFFVTGYLFSATIWMCRYLILFFLAAAVAEIPVFTTLLRIAGMWLTALLIPTPGSSGGMEGLFLLFVGPLLPAAAGGVVVTAWRLLSYHLIIVIGLAVTARTIQQALRGRSDNEDA
ncbi:MAG: lysylphosphatidylglycerol synthase transmembrane domain-containing protein [Bacteroidota bacterium]